MKIDFIIPLFVVVVLAASIVWQISSGAVEATDAGTQNLVTQWILAITSIFGVILLFLNLLEARATARAAMASSENAQETNYIALKPELFVPNFNFIKNIPNVVLEVALSIDNKGGSSALDVELNSIFIVADVPQPIEAYQTETRQFIGDISRSTKVVQSVTPNKKIGNIKSEADINHGILFTDIKYRDYRGIEHHHVTLFEIRRYQNSLKIVVSRRI